MMRRLSDAPIVSFARDGQVFELGRSGLSSVLHMYGSTGLGIAPVSIASSDRLAGDGAIVRGVRYGTRELFIPLRMGAQSPGELAQTRRELTRLLAPHLGPVDVRIQDPATGTDRMIRGYYKDGLTGDFGTSFYGHWQKLGLTFECPDPWWLGQERTSTLQLNPGSKPFLSDQRGTVLRRNLVRNPFGPGATDTDLWRVRGGHIEPVEDEGRFAGRYVKTVADSGSNYIDPVDDISPPMGSRVSWSVDVRVEVASQMRLTISTYGGAVLSDYVADYSPQSPADGWVRWEQSATVTAMPAGGYLRTLVWPGSGDFPVGQGFLVRRALVEVDPPEDAPYFDGDSEGCQWSAGRSPSESIMWDPADVGSPFFPVVLAESVVQGDWTVMVEGDGPVYPIWEVTGPGTDLRIIRGDDRIEVDGEVRSGETLLIDTAAGRISPDRWDDVSLRSRLFPLHKGRNRLQVSMVGATTDTTVRLLYRERYLEGL